MNLHQVLTGAVNAGDHCYSVGSVEGVPFTVYAAGCNIVILASNFQRVQIIPGVCHGNVQVGCIDCSTDVGKIAAAYGKQVCIFEPSPLLHQSSPHKLDYKWIQTATINAECIVTVLSWNLEGTTLLTGGECIQMWLYSVQDENDIVHKDTVTFHVGGYISGDRNVAEEQPKWDCVWKCKTAQPVNFLKFSPDGTLFASAGKADRLVKIWYENKKVNLSSQGTKHCSINEKNYTFIYTAHPRAVTGLSWRKTSKFMPRASVANMLVTSCKDNICRLWVQTLIPEDGLVNLQQIEALANQTPRLQTQRHRQRIMQKYKHMKSFNEYKRRQASQFTEDPNETIPTLPSTYSVHDFHSFGLQGSGVAPGLHFHLAASINAETDIPLVPSMSGSRGGQEPNLMVHWLNNKEMAFSQSAENLIQELSVRILNHDKAAADSAKQEQEDAGARKSKQRSPRLVHLQKTSSAEEADDEPLSKKSFSPVSSSASLATEGSMKTVENSLGEALDRKIEVLLREWHKTPDLLFSIHPVDGSFLVWLVDWLDEYSPGSFRQAVVSFSTRIPNAIPLGDAATMSHNLSLYLPTAGLDLKTVLQSLNLDSAPKTAVESPEKPDLEAAGPAETKSKQTCCSASPTPTICMLSKHSNGSLNLWHLMFKENTSFTKVLSIGHASRVSGHRFRINDINCHPVLPLLLTTSHHNSPNKTGTSVGSGGSTPTAGSIEAGDACFPIGFCSELILWKVDPVGPLSKSGGVTELARISSPHTSAFANVAWVPTLLPSTTLGSISNSPSACFVASDGQQLRVYQAVIDARTLLAEVSTAERRNRDQDLSMSSSTSSGLAYRHTGLHDSFKIVSLQSTARPGCIIELSAISDATHDWQNTQLLHVFQEQLIMGNRSGTCQTSSVDQSSSEKNVGLLEPSHQAFVDLRHASVFEEPFYLVVVEKADNMRSVLHMWRILIASQPANDAPQQIYTYVPDSNLVQDSDHSDQTSRSNSPEPPQSATVHTPQASPLLISTTKVCTQELPLPEDVEIAHATPAAGHLSSSNIYPACFAPYVICTACTDGLTRFWKCQVERIGDNENNEPSNYSYSWVEWEMVLNKNSSAIQVPGNPLCVSCAYSGRLACAYKYGHSFTRPTSQNPDEKFINISVAIYECESTGGSEWILEDTIHLKNISLPKPDKLGIDLGPLYDANYRNRRTVDTLVQRLTSTDDLSNEHAPGLKRLLSVPSYSTIQTLRRAIIEQGNQCLLIQKSLVQLDWVSSEDGSHVLTVAVGPKIMLFTPVSSDIAQANLQAMNASKTSSSRPLLKQMSSMAPPIMGSDMIRWMQIRSTRLVTADSLPPLPMQLSWVRDGILVVGMDSEMHIYSQWKPQLRDSSGRPEDEVDGTLKSRYLTEEELISRAQETTHLRFTNTAPGSLPRNTSSNVLPQHEQRKKKETQGKTAASGNSQDGIGPMPDFGLFETSRLACAVLPQYHPKQLMELLGFGKIRRVKAILSHLVRCLAKTGNIKQSTAISIDAGENRNEADHGPRSWSRSRTLSIAAPAAIASSPGQHSPMEPGAGSVSVVPEEVQLDYVEITSIPPLPLFALLAADKEIASSSTPTVREGGEQKNKDYTGLFEPVTAKEQSLEDILEEEVDMGHPKRERLKSTSEKNLSYFGPRQARLLTRLLTHCHLPGLSSLDQMHLLALADTVASFNTALSERFDSDAHDALDDSGLRFLLAVRHHIYLLRCLPLYQRAQLQKQGLGSQYLVWAFHSETQEELIQLIPSIQRGNARWADLRELGVGWWIRSNQLLRKIIEKIAKAAFQRQQNPLDAALFYMALKKKNLLAGLFRSANDRKMSEFFQNNFTQDRWRKAALKNAYVLLGKQRFDHAAAFFLLAGQVRDAVQVCLNKLDDIQLAMIIVRLYEGDLESTPGNYQRLLYEEVLGCEENSKVFRPSYAHFNPFIRSMAYWLLHDYTSALTTLLQTDIGDSHPKTSEEELKAMHSHHTADPSVFNFYLYLRTHPLVIRRQLAKTVQEKRQARAIMLSGFKYSSVSKTLGKTDLQPSQDFITPLERRLFFTTSHAHFRAGCPSLALEVLSRLPNCVLDENPEEDSLGNSPKNFGNAPLVNGEVKDSAKNFDWSQPVSTLEKEKASDFDWGQPVSNLNSSSKEKASNFDWGAPTTTFKDEPPVFKIAGLDDEEEEEEEKGLQMKTELDVVVDEVLELQRQEQQLDIMAQQLKFIACLKIMMEELSTLATGFEVDGGQLRYQLYIWLERCVAALKELCHYGHTPGQHVSDTSMGPENLDMEKLNLRHRESGFDFPTLHEILLLDKQDFEAKLVRAAKRKQWLKANEALLRTLLSYTSLHGAHGGGLAAVRMELNLLLQELQQDRSQQQLFSPLPFPTTLPLLAASVACQKTVVADPIRHLQFMAHDILQSIMEMNNPPLMTSSTFASISTLWDLSMSLSACIYQALCDSDSFCVKQGANPGLDVEDCLSLSVVYQNSHLLAGHATRRRRLSSNEEPLVPSTAPSKWPGVQSLRALLSRDNDEDSPKLHTLLCESFVAVYLSQLVHALASCDCHILYRLVGQKFTERTWSMLFGGGAKKLLKVSHVKPSQPAGTPNSQPEKEATPTGESGILDALARQRVKWNMKILTQLKNDPPQTSIKEDRPTYREQFVPPEMSMVSCFMSKPGLPDQWAALDYDSADSIASDEELNADEDGDIKNDDVFNEIDEGNPLGSRNRHPSQSRYEQLDPSSYSWNILRYSVVKLVHKHLIDFLSVAGIELQDLPVISPLIHASLKVIEHWLRHLKEALDNSGGPPHNLLQNCYVEATPQNGPSILKYKVLLDVNNTPFRGKHTASYSARRLWNYLVRQEEVQEIFIRYIFSHKFLSQPQHDVEILDDDHSVDYNVPDPIRIIHKDQDSISAFCVSKAADGIIALATPKELQELDISVLLEPLPWLDDEAEFDILNLNKPPDAHPSSMDYLVVQHPTDKGIVSTGHGSAGGSAFNSPTSAVPPPIGTQTGRGTTVLKKHRIDGIRRLCAHPRLPVYLSGSQDGSVRMWEWGHSQPVAHPRHSGTFAKVSSILFNQLGNKFGVTDGDGTLSLWQAELASISSKPFFSAQCHTKQASDFSFINSSSLIATAGHSAENRNVCIWDTLLPHRKSLVNAFTCHEHGSSAILFAPQNQLLISAGKKGDISIFDVRQRVQRHKFQAHDTAIKCLALDPSEEFYVSGSADGDIKVWGLSVHVLLFSFQNEHSRSTLFRNIGMGVSHMVVDAQGRLFSCGADGSMKLRQLPDRDLVVNSVI